MGSPVSWVPRDSSARTSNLFQGEPLLLRGDPKDKKIYDSDYNGKMYEAWLT